MNFNVLSTAKHHLSVDDSGVRKGERVKRDRKGQMERENVPGGQTDDNQV